MKHKVALKVHQPEKEDVYHDRARIPEEFRGGIREGRICEISVAGKSALLEVRGIIDEKEQIIRLDEVTRNRLNVDAGKTCDFTLREAWWLGQFLWAWSASDSAARMAARLGLLGLILGLLALGIGVIPLIKCH
ncbi:MAG: hypothetical protein ABSC88_11905 [Terracidiphilus sp.]|jgi:hypothetical protein